MPSGERNSVKLSNFDQTYKFMVTAPIRKLLQCVQQKKSNVNERENSHHTYIQSTLNTMKKIFLYKQKLKPQPSSKRVANRKPKIIIEQQ